MMQILLAGVGGFLGAAGRHSLSGLVQRVAGSPWFPWGTLAVNVVGCLGIGLLGGWAEARGPWSEHARVLLISGLLGGFTTYSAFGYETVQLVRGGQGGIAALSVGAQVLLGLGAVLAGLWIGRQF